MEFRYRAGEEREHAPMGYFANQALRAGISAESSNLVPPTISRKEVLLEELRREQIREELLAREIANKRMIEEQIRRELELERLMAMTRFEEERLLHMEPRVGFSEIRGHGFAPRYPEISEDGIRPPIYRDIGVDEGSGSQQERIDIRRTSSQERGIGAKKELGKPFTKPKFLDAKNKFPQNKASDHKLSGFKRKVAAELPRPPLKEWSCSLCGVSATCQKNLNVHLQGKKHKAKQEETAERKAMLLSKKPKLSAPKYGDDVPQVKSVSKKNDKEGKTPHHKHPSQKARPLWCGLCKVKCNSLAMLDCHLKGKKHLAQLEAKNGGGDGGDGASTAPTAAASGEVKRHSKAKGTEGNSTREANGEKESA